MIALIALAAWAALFYSASKAPTPPDWTRPRSYVFIGTTWSIGGPTSFSFFESAVVQSEWQMEFCGPGIVFRPHAGDHPNWLHRQTQRICFGFVWRKVR